MGTYVHGINVCSNRQLGGGGGLAGGAAEEEEEEVHETYVLTVPCLGLVM